MSGLKMRRDRGVVQPVFMYLFYGLVSIIFMSCASKSDSDWVDKARHLLWTNPEDCLVFLDSIYPSISSSNEQQYWQLCREHTMLRVNRWIENDSLLNELASFFLSQQDYRHAGETNYLLGTYYILHDQPPLAVYRLKDAEFYLRQATPLDTNLLGIVLYRLGNAFEDEYLYDFAAIQYEKAIPYLSHCDNKLYVASCYRDIGCKKENLEREERAAYLDTARFWYNQIPDSEIYLQVVKCRMLELQDTVSQELLNAYKYLCNFSPTLINAQRLILYYLEQNQLDSCEKYLKILEQDTCYSDWSKENYLHLCAMYYQQNYDYQNACYFHKECYDAMETRLYHKTLSQSIVISQQYDLSKEKESAMLMQITRQQERLLLAIIVLILCGLSIVLLMVYYHHKIQYQQKIEQQSLDIVRLSEENNAKQQALKAKLNHRIQQAQQEHLLSHLTKGYSREELEQIKQEFELIYDNRLQSLQHQYNKLTETDAYVIVLMVLGYDIQNCCILLNMQKATLWQRRKRIKQRLDLPLEADVDGWLKKYFQ